MILEADWTWTGERFESGVRVQVGGEGKIVRADRSEPAAQPDPGPPVRRLVGRALLPGMVNAHSHAFQRGLRGLGEQFPGGSGSFWIWREAMYALVDALDGDAFFRLSRQAFREMLAAGITTVGEFHYFHHSKRALDFALDGLLLDAAREAGIRIVLLNIYYRTGGIGKPLGFGQHRFGTGSIQEYWDQMDRLRDSTDRRTQTVGAGAHSLRAARPEEIAELQGESLRRELAFHIHVEEQRGEVEEVLASYGRRPMALLNEAFSTASNVTAVHCTHTAAEDMGRYLAAGGRVCVNPLTEGNLGDGLPDLSPVHAAGRRLALGSDSNNRISLLEEMRWLEYGQRLRTGRRGLLADARGGLGPVLLQAATLGGARALGVDAGRIAPGAWADFFTIDLDHPALAGGDETTLLDRLVFGAGNEVIREVCVGGEWQTITQAAAR